MTNYVILRAVADDTDGAVFYASLFTYLCGVRWLSDRALDL